MASFRRLHSLAAKRGSTSVLSKGEGKAGQQNKEENAAKQHKISSCVAQVRSLDNVKALARVEVVCTKIPHKSSSKFFLHRSFYFEAPLGPSSRCISKSDHVTSTSVIQRVMSLFSKRRI